MQATLAGSVRAHQHEVACVDVHDDALASAGGRALRLWRWRPRDGWTLAAEQRAAHRHGVTAARWAPAGALLASGGVDGSARVWRGAGGALVAVRSLVAPGAEAVRALAWAGGARLAAAHDDGHVRVWTARGDLLACVRALDAAVHALCALAADRLLLAAGADGALKLYDLAELCAGAAEGDVRALQEEDGAHDLGALCAAASADGARAATGGHDALVRVWRVRGARVQAAPALAGHAAAVTALCWGGAEGALCSASLDRTARVWAASGACVLLLHAHPRYLTCVALDPRLRYLVTGSNDRTLRTWSLGTFTADDELAPPCDPVDHYALGDLEGIGPVEEPDEEATDRGVGEQDEGGARLLWREAAHAGAVNCVAVCGERLATASSDGVVKLWRWEAARLRLEHALEAHRYPALAADFAPGGAALLTAGLDGCAVLWDVETGVPLRSLSVPHDGGGEAGGGGVRDARLAGGARALLATDDGLAAVWAAGAADAAPQRVYAGHAEAVACCAWSADGALAATGAASGELRVLAPPHPRHLHHDSAAHDLGVLGCDFAPPSADVRLPPGAYLLATAGCDSLLKLWRVDYDEVAVSAHVCLLRAVVGGGGAVWRVRWCGGALVSGGADGWARVWRVRAGAGGARVRAVGAARVGGAGGAAAAALGPRLLAVGALNGELCVWRLPAPPPPDTEDDVAPRLWTARGVVRWLREYVLRPTGTSAAEAARLTRRARARGLTGARLLDDDLDRLMTDFGYEEESADTQDATTEGAEESDEHEENDDVEEEDAEEEASEGEEEDAGGQRGAVRARLLAELAWLRRAPPPPAVAARAPHWARCPLTHRVLREPARAADGYSYERTNVREWLLAHEGAPVSPVSGRPLRNTSVAPNYGLRDRLRDYLDAAAAEGDPEDPADEDPADEDPGDPADPPDLIDLTAGEAAD